MMPARKRTPAELWKALEAQAAADDMERIAALSPEELDRELATAGFDPKEVGDEGEALAKRLLAQRDAQAWQAAAHEKLAKVQAEFEERAKKPRAKLTRDQLLERITIARADPRLAAPVAVMFRHRPVEEASVEELEEMLDEIEALAERTP
jgi:hypothetical protein